MLSLSDRQFSAEDRQAMLALARAAIVSVFDGKPLKHAVAEPACLSLRQGVFVTLEVFGKLRGCIGVIEPNDALRESNAHCPQSGALHDPPSSPLRRRQMHG